MAKFSQIHAEIFVVLQAVLEDGGPQSLHVHAPREEEVREQAVEQEHRLGEARAAALL